MEGKFNKESEKKGSSLCNISRHKETIKKGGSVGVNRELDHITDMSHNRVRD